MLQTLHLADYLVLFLLLFLMVGGSIWQGYRNKNTEDYFMAGRSLKWWSVAGSIYGTNVSLTQIIGMLGIGYSIGFAQSHYEVLAVPAILLLCYVFVPVYRKRKIFTLSQFLEHRYNKHARLLYSVLIILIILILLVGGFYIGSRQLGLLFRGSSFQIGYLQGILLIGGISSLLVYIGGMSSVVVAENIITLLMVITVLLVGSLTLYDPAIGGFSGLLQLDAQQPAAAQKMHLYLPTNHPDLPWTGVFSGLMVLHSFFWTTNQFEVQRILAAQTDRQARLGALAAAFLKLLIPFFSVAAGVAAAYLFRFKYNLQNVPPDDAFIFLVSKVVPAGYGLLGLILAGFTGAIFSSIYSMLNSAATLLSMDVFKQYLRPTATDKQIVWFGRLSVFFICALAALLAWVSFDPTASGNFFLTLSKNTSYLKPGIVSAFFLGVFWKKTHPVSAVAAIVLAPVIGLGLEAFYAALADGSPSIKSLFGAQLNFMHRVLLTFVVCAVLQIAISIYYHQKTGFIADPTDLVPAPGRLIQYVIAIAVVHALLLSFLFVFNLNAKSLALPAGIFTAAVFFHRLWQRRKEAEANDSIFSNDVFYAGLLAGVTAWILYYFA